MYHLAIVCHSNIAHGKDLGAAGTNRTGLRVEWVPQATGAVPSDTAFWMRSGWSKKSLKEHFGLARCTLDALYFDYTSGPALDDDQPDANQEGRSIGTN